VADQDVILGDVAQTLTIRHVTTDRTSFMPGVLMASARSRTCRTGSRWGSSACSGLGRLVLVAVTDHAAERYRQRVRGTLDARAEVVARVSRAWAGGELLLRAAAGAAAQRGSVYVRDGRHRLRLPRGQAARRAARRDAVGGRRGPAVPRRFTDALKREERRRR
jgi:hypothetical protein